MGVIRQDRGRPTGSSVISKAVGQHLLYGGLEVTHTGLMGPNKPAEQAEADARLIAAAPELLKELTDFHAHAIDQGWHDCDGIPGGCPAVAAIAKATGAD